MDKPCDIKAFASRFWPTAIVLAIIIYATLSSDPIGADELPLIPHIDKLIHAVMMGGLLGAIVFDLQRSDRTTLLRRRTIIIATLAVMAFGAVDEVIQATVVDRRSGDILDLIADWTGTWVAFFTAPPAVRKVLKMKNQK